MRKLTAFPCDDQKYFFAVWVLTDVENVRMSVDFKKAALADRLEADTRVEEQMKFCQLLR